jgi:hypothetical protein
MEYDDEYVILGQPPLYCEWEAAHSAGQSPEDDSFSDEV